ncbi:MAG: hypothetical protein WCI76_03265 [bacterium]
MENYLKEALCNATLVPQSDLAGQSWNAINIYNKRICRLRLALFSLAGLISLGTLIPVAKILLTDVKHSGIFEYVSLVISSNASFLNYWKDFISLLAESLPIISMASLLTLILLFFLSVKYIIREIVKIKLIINNTATLSF